MPGPIPGKTNLYRVVSFRDEPHQFLERAIGSSGVPLAWAGGASASVLRRALGRVDHDVDDWSFAGDCKSVAQCESDERVA